MQPSTRIMHVTATCWCSLLSVAGESVARRGGKKTESNVDFFRDFPSRVHDFHFSCDIVHTYQDASLRARGGGTFADSTRR